MKLTLNIVLVVLLFGSMPLFGQSEGLTLKIKAFKAELGMEGIQVRSLGGDSAGVMIEGEVGSVSMKDRVKSVASQYFTQVFDVTNVAPKKQRYSVFAFLMPKTIPDTLADYYLKVLLEGADKNKPWHFLLPGDKEANLFRQSLTDEVGAKALQLKLPRKAVTSCQVLFKDEDHYPYEIQMESVNMGNGFVETSFNIFDQWKANPLLRRKLYSRQGEWIAIVRLQEEKEGNLLLLCKAEEMS